MTDALIALLALASAYPDAHVRASATKDAHLYYVSFDCLSTREQEFLQLVRCDDGESAMLYHARPARARQTFDADLRAGMHHGFLEDLARSLRKREKALAQGERVPLMIEVETFGTTRAITQQFLNAAYRMLRAREN